MNSSMICQLPVNKQLSPKTLGNEESSHTCPPPKFLKVLIVDNNDGRLTANAEMISGFGHVVEVARDGIMALRMAASNRPDAVLLCTNLRSRDECDIATHLRLDFPRRPPLIIGLASDANKIMRRRCVEAEIDLVLEAPLDAEAIETVLLLECSKLTIETNADTSNGSYRQGRIPARSLITQKTNLALATKIDSLDKKSRFAPVASGNCTTRREIPSPLC